MSHTIFRARWAHALIAGLQILPASARAQPSPEPVASVPSGRTLTVNGVELYYEEVGRGAPLLLLHRYGACGSIWEPHRDRLAQHRRLIIPDLRGHGRSGDGGAPFRHRDAALDLFALLDALGVDRFEAMGISSGGMTLLHMATQQPDRISAMVLIGATTHFGPEARAIMQRSTPELLSPEQLAVWGACSVRGEGQTHTLLRDFHAFKDVHDDMSFTEAGLSAITARTLIVHGDRDEFFPVAIATAMYRAIPRASLWVVPDGGHIPVFGARTEDFQEGALRFLGVVRR